VRILYVIDSLAPGGAERSLASMAPSLINFGVGLHVAYLVERPGVHEELRRAGATVTSVSSGTMPGRIGELRGIIRAERPDLVHTTLFEADVAGRAAAWLGGVPVVSSLVNVAYGPEQRPDRGLSRVKLEGARLVDAVSARAAVRFHALTQHVAQSMGRRLRIPTSRIDVIPRGRDPVALGRRSTARRQAARGTLGVAERAPLILGAARHERQKGLDVLIDAFPLVLGRYPDAVLIIAGRQGATTVDLASRIDRLSLGSAVRLLGARSDVPDILAAADVFAFPSRWEGLGSVLLEAMAVEAPIVASDIPAVSELLDPGTALLVPPGDHRALAAGIVRSLEEPGPASVRTRRARDVFESRFTIDRIADQMMHFYSRALAA
jgi:glycosyltransferase involved in cell wall biosynthesis